MLAGGSACNQAREPARFRKDEAGEVRLMRPCCSAPVLSARCGLSRTWIRCRPPAL